MSEQSGFCNYIKKYIVLNNNDIGLEIDIYKCDERLTSKEAEYYLREKKLKPSKNKDKIDQLSASIILTQFLSSKNNEIL